MTLESVQCPPKQGMEFNVVLTWSFHQRKHFCLPGWMISPTPCVVLEVLLNLQRRFLEEAWWWALWCWGSPLLASASIPGYLNLDQDAYCHQPLLYAKMPVCSNLWAYGRSSHCFLRQQAAQFSWAQAEHLLMLTSQAVPYHPTLLQKHKGPPSWVAGIHSQSSRYKHISENKQSNQLPSTSTPSPSAFSLQAFPSLLTTEESETSLQITWSWGSAPASKCPRFIASQQWCIRGYRVIQNVLPHLFWSPRQASGSGARQDFSLFHMAYL